METWMLRAPQFYPDPSAVSYADVRLRRESSMEECRKTSDIQVPDEPLELSAIDHSRG